MVKVQGTSTFANAPTGSSAPDSLTLGPGGTTWVEYGNGATSNGAPPGGSSTIVEYDSHGNIVQSYTLTGLADGLKYDPATGNVWALMNNDGNANLQLINPSTGQVSAPLDYGSGYVYGAGSSRGFDDVAFIGKKVFLSETNPASTGDAVVVQLLNGTAPFGTLETKSILSLGDTGTNLTTGQTNQPLPVSDPDSLKVLPNGSLILTSEADDSLTIISHPGTTKQTASFITLPNGFSPDDAIIPTAHSGTFTIANTGSNDVLQAHVTGLNPNDIYAILKAQGELVQIDPKTGAITPVVTGLSNPHGLAFTPSKSSSGGEGDGCGGWSKEHTGAQHDWIATLLQHHG